MKDYLLRLYNECILSDWQMYSKLETSALYENFIR